MFDQIFKVPFNRPLRGATLDPYLPGDAARSEPRHIGYQHHDAASAKQAAGDTQQRIEQLFEDLSHQLSEMESRRSQSLGEMQHVAIELAMEIADKLVHGLIEMDQFPIEQWVHQITKPLPANQPLIVYLSGDDHRLLQQQMESGHVGIDPNQLRFEVNQQFPRGRCLVEAPGGELFYDVGLQLGEVRQRIMESLHEVEIERRAAAGNDSPLRRFPNRRSSG